MAGARASQPEGYRTHAAHASHRHAHGNGASHGNGANHEAKVDAKRDFGSGIL